MVGITVQNLTLLERCGLRFDAKDLYVLKKLSNVSVAYFFEGFIARPRDKCRLKIVEAAE